MPLRLTDIGERLHVAWSLEAVGRMEQAGSLCLRTRLIRALL